MGGYSWQRHFASMILPHVSRYHVMCHAYSPNYWLLTKVAHCLHVRLRILNRAHCFLLDGYEWLVPAWLTICSRIESKSGYKQIFYFRWKEEVDTVIEDLRPFHRKLLLNVRIWALWSNAASCHATSVGIHVQKVLQDKMQTARLELSFIVLSKNLWLALHSA